MVWKVGEPCLRHAGEWGGTNQPRSPFPPGSVLYISLHRYDRGTFFPMGEEGASSQIGRAAGTGFTVNVAWNGPRVGDADYLAAWHRLVLPIAYEVQYRMCATMTVWVTADLCMSDFWVTDPVGQPAGGHRNGLGMFLPHVIAFSVHNCKGLLGTWGSSSCA